MKRIYKAVAIGQMADGYSVLLDTRPVRTPAGCQLTVPTAPLAQAIAEEWAAQSEQVKPHTMPLTQLASTAIDRVVLHRSAMIDQLLNYGATDLLCYRAEGPRDLVERQERVWQPLIDWASVALGAELVVTSGVVPVPQPSSSFAVLRRLIEAYGDLQLTALQSAVAATGSLVLGLALVEGRIGPQETFEASQLDELYEVELWGDDPEAAARRDALRKDVLAAARLISLAAS